MTNLPESKRPAECLSDFRFDALLGSELEAEDARAAEQHIASCERCTRRIGELRADVDAFDIPLPTAPARVAEVVPLASRRRPTWARWAGAASSVVAIAAAVLLWVRMSSEPVAPDGVRLKGTAHVGFFVEHAGRVRRGFPGEKVQPADKLQFAVSTHEPAYVAVVSIDGARGTSVYYTSTSRVGPTIGDAEEPIPVSILLDNVLGDELLWGLVCKSQQAEAELRGLLEREGVAFSTPRDCVKTAWTITKVARLP